MRVEESRSLQSAANFRAVVKACRKTLVRPALQSALQWLLVWIFVGCVVATFVGPARAQTTRTVHGRVADLERDLAELLELQLVVVEKLEGLEDKHVSKSKAVEDLRTELSSLRNYIASVHREMAALRAGSTIRAADIDQRVSKSKAVTDLHSSLAQLHNDLAAIRRDIIAQSADDTTRATAIDERFNGLTARLDGLQSDSAALRNETAARRRELAEFRNETAGLKTDVASLSTSLDNRFGELTSRIAELEQAEAEHRAAEQLAAERLATAKARSQSAPPRVGPNWPTGQEPNLATNPFVRRSPKTSLTSSSSPVVPQAYGLSGTWIHNAATFSFAEAQDGTLTIHRALLPGAIEASGTLKRRTDGTYAGYLEAARGHGSYRSQSVPVRIRPVAARLVVFDVLLPTPLGTVRTTGDGSPGGMTLLRDDGSLPRVSSVVR